MENKGLKIIGTTVVVAGLMTGAFLAGGIATSSQSGAEPELEPTAIVEAVEAEDTDGGIVLVGDEQDEDTADEAAAPQQQPQAPIEPTAAPVEPTPAPPVVEPTPAPLTPEPTPVNEAPFVVSISPVDGAIGVSPSANIVVTFSEAMDKASAQAALNLSIGNCGAFSWNADATAMTFDPCGDLAYGVEVDVEVYDSAADKLGLAMHDEFESSFRVIRKLTETLYSQAGYDGHIFAPPVLTLINPVSSSSSMTVGTWSRGFLSFDLSNLPEDLTKILSADVRVFQTGHHASAYGLDTGRLMIQSVSYGSLNLSDWNKAAIPFCNGLCVVPLPTEWTLSDSAADGWKNVNVIGAVMQDWGDREARGERSQFRIKFQAENNGAGPNIWAKFASGDAAGKRPMLTITYFAP